MHILATVNKQLPIRSQADSFTVSYTTGAFYLCLLYLVFTGGYLLVTLPGLVKTIVCSLFLLVSLIIRSGIALELKAHARYTGRHEIGWSVFAFLLPATALCTIDWLDKKALAKPVRMDGALPLYN